MEKTNFNKSVGKMRSLMERIGSNMTAYEAMINEDKLITEATSKNRVQVSRDEILRILDEADEIQDANNSGLFATVTYVKPASILKTRAKIDTEKLSKALDANKHRSEESWHKDLTSFRDAEKSSTKNPIQAVITVTRYHLRWHSLKNYNADYNSYSTELSNLRMRHGIGIQSDGKLGDNHNQRQDTDATGAARFNQTGNMSRDYNMARKVGKPKSTAYLVDETGHVVSEIPNDVMWAIHSKKASKGVEAEVRNTLSGEALEAYAKAKAELDAKFDGKNLLYDKTLCICCSVNGVSYYYINDQLISAIASKSEVNVNQNDMINIAKEQLGESFDVIQGFSN